MKSSTTKTKRTQRSPEAKVVCFLRLPPAINEWLVEEVKTGRYGNVQEKIVDVLRDAQLRHQESQAA